MSSLLTADIHQTENPRDKHRWGLFKWLREEAQRREVDQVILLGDLTDEKDRHSASLVNRLVDEIDELAHVVHVDIIAGNHDYIDPTTPFFRFMSRLKNVTFMVEPRTGTRPIRGKPVKCLFIPSTRSRDANALAEVARKSEVSYIFCHQTFTGALAENGQQMSGIPISIFDGIKAKVYSGDIHVPQKIGPVEYVGAPYRVRFGDTFEPRVLFLDKEGAHDLHYPCLSKHVLVVRSFDGRMFHGIAKGDQVKVRVQLKRSEFPDWPLMKQKIRDLANEYQVELHAVQLVSMAEKRDDEPQMRERQKPEQHVASFAKAKKLDEDLRDIGLSLIKGG